MGHGKQRQRGLASVEFTIILPVIVLVALGVTELGRGLYQYNTLHQSVRDGARYLSDVAIGPLGTVDIAPHITDTQNLVVYGDIDGAASGRDPVLATLSTGDVSVTAVAVTLPGGGILVNHVQIDATAAFTPLFPALSALGYSMLPALSVSTIQRALTL